MEERPPDVEITCEYIE